MATSKSVLPPCDRLQIGQRRPRHASDSTITSGITTSNTRRGTRIWPRTGLRILGRIDQTDQAGAILGSAGRGNVLISRKLVHFRGLGSQPPLGSLRDIARELDLGGDAQKVKKALRQNARAFISAKLTYKTADGTEKILEADFNRYGMIFLGEKLPDGRRADQVYVTFNEPYRDVLNNAPVRPLDYDYLKRLPPSPQRFYEILSYRVFAAIKFRHTEAKLPYSEYCTFSAQQRYSDYEPFRKQMYKVQRPHLMSGYLASFRYEESKDEEGKRDWIMYYEPGPKARAEYRSFTGDKQRVVEAAPALTGAGETTSALPIRRAPARQHRLNLQPASQEPLQAPINPDHLAARTSKGVLESEARKHLAHLPPGQKPA